MVSAVQNFIAEPIRHRRFDLAWYRLTQLLHERTNGAFDNAYMRLTPIIRPKVELPASKQLDPSEVSRVVERLRQDGYNILPKGLTAADIEAITNFAFTTPAFAGHMDKRVVLTRDGIPKGEPRFSWWMHDLVRVPAIQRLIADGPYCQIAQEYLGCRPTLAHISLFLDAPYEGDYGAYRYHYDNDGPGFLKFFIFITDVEVGTGAHYFIAGSHTRSKPAAFARATLYDEGPLLASYGRDKETVMRGAAGMVLAEDTAGFHRGSTIERDYRLMMQFEFSAIETPTDQELARKIEPIAVPGMHPGIASIARKYYVSAGS
jgi:hypothetical protein